jgi:hypothetical protein
MFHQALTPDFEASKVSCGNSIMDTIIIKIIGIIRYAGFCSFIALNYTSENVIIERESKGVIGYADSNSNKKSTKNIL